MPTTTDLTSADLSEIRQSALGAADPLGVAAELAAAADSGRLADPQDAGYALALAAEIAESRSKLDAALRYADRAVEAYGDRDDSGATSARALRARVLFRAGRADEAIAALEPLRPALTRHSDAAAYIGAALAAGGRNRVAEEWLTEAVRAVLDERAAAGQTADPSSADEAGLLFFLLQQRHRTRHALGLPHDVHDNLADRLENRLAAARTTTAEDELVFWPQAEFTTVVTRWPALTEVYGATWDDHRAQLEQRLTRRGGTPSLLPGVADDLARFAGIGGTADAATRSGYARSLAAGTGLIAWPPARNDACWCGSGAKYKKCCLPRAR
ncbi:SEC-C domain-containing protein [Actinoplanes couchii]|uniref:Preprotein translocase SecA n=1 Tax=Actinoplanes couchii TaxID=403638 RepID=A0ABQ3XTA9_9ACTN|nr:SEC-C domain-containing protein [Actinoplanes couchii]MDR6317027.1 tetratricopeptide (TPR) repeat protein [Actinoplanes couchii]GID61726.1 preprotein translocase SecA [Actinoplanes couchii]